jgi:nitroreductase
MELLDAFKWRYATKKYDAAKKVDQVLIDKIVEAARIAPTSSGLQPFEVFVITNQELKNKIVPITLGQEIVADCSHLLVFAAWDNYTAERIDTIYSYITKEREQPADRYQAYTDRLKSMYLNRTAEENFAHAARQAYIAFGFAMAEAASLKVDTTPMEGFINDELDQLLNLSEKGLKSVTLLPVGYRDEANDWLVNLNKVRHPKEKFVTVID